MTTPPVHAQVGSPLATDLGTPLDLHLGLKLCLDGLDMLVRTGDEKVVGMDQDLSAILLRVVPKLRLRLEPDPSELVQ